MKPANEKIVDDMAKLPELVAPRIQGDNIRPEVLIKPRFDLAADLGVTTSALSQTIRKRIEARRAQLRAGQSGNNASPSNAQPPKP